MKNSKIFLLSGALAVMMGFSAAPAQAGEPLIGQITAFAGTFCPRGWADANGGLLPIAQNTALFAVLGTQFGGDGRSTLGLPDLRGRRPIGDGNGPGIGSYLIGQRGGSVEFFVITPQLPSHNHTGRVKASSAPADTNSPIRNDFAIAGANIYVDNSAPNNNMAANTVLTDNTGGGQSVNKLSPYQAVRWCVATTGVFPSRS